MKPLVIENGRIVESNTTIDINDLKKRTRTLFITESSSDLVSPDGKSTLYIRNQDDWWSLGSWNNKRQRMNFYVDDNGIYINDIKIPNINEVFKLGDFRLFPFPPNELPFGWYLRNGDRHSVDSNIGRALKSLSEDFKFRWLIFELDGYINLPNAFNYNGDGYFERAVDGVKRQAGSIQVDTIRNIRGWFTATTGSEDIAGGVFFKERSTQGYTQWGTGYNDGRSIVFDTSRVVPTSHENRPINIGMTPAIYLGV